CCGGAFCGGCRGLGFGHRSVLQSKEWAYAYRRTLCWHMNAQDMNVNLVKIVLQPFAAVTLCAGLSACAFDPPADPASPLATRIDSLVAEKRDYPRWQDFPAAPVNVPDAATVRTAVTGLEASQGVLNSE